MQQITYYRMEDPPSHPSWFRIPPAQPEFRTSPEDSGQDNELKEGKSERMTFLNRGTCILRDLESQITEDKKERLRVMLGLLRTGFFYITIGLLGLIVCIVLVHLIVYLIMMVHVLITSVLEDPFTDSSLDWVTSVSSPVSTAVSLSTSSSIPVTIAREAISLD